MPPPNVESRDTSLLIDKMREKVELLIKNCQDRANLKVVPFFTLRGPETQGRLWCRSRSITEVSSARKLLQNAGAPILASYLRDDWAGKDRWATNSLPGQSWHQWGEACDCYIEVAGKALWSSGLYKSVYAEEAVNLGLEAGANWKMFPDAVHVQFRKLHNPMDDHNMDWPKLEQAMLAKFFSEVVS